MGQAQINVRTRACSRTSIARTRQAALTHNVRGKELKCYKRLSASLQLYKAFFFDYLVYGSADPILQDFEKNNNNNYIFFN